MNKETLKKAKIYSILLLIFFVSIGSLIIYRTTLKDSELERIDGKIVSIETQKFRNSRRKKGWNYAIVFKIEDHQKFYGINSGTEDQTLIKRNDLNIFLDENYSLYIDPTVSTSNNVNLGVRLVKFEDKEIYRENKRASVYFGSFFIILGIASGLWRLSLGKKKSI